MQQVAPLEPTMLSATPYNILIKKADALFITGRIYQKEIDIHNAIYKLKDRLPDAHAYDVTLREDY
jgi:hypothetical protein